MSDLETEGDFKNCIIFKKIKDKTEKARDRGGARTSENLIMPKVSENLESGDGQLEALRLANYAALSVFKRLAFSTSL